MRAVSQLAHHESNMGRLDEVSFKSAESYEEDVNDGIVDGVVVGVVDVTVLIVVVPSRLEKQRFLTTFSSRLSVCLLVTIIKLG